MRVINTLCPTSLQNFLLLHSTFRCFMPFLPTSIIVDSVDLTDSSLTEDSNHVDDTEADTSEDQQADTPEVNKLFEDEHYGLDDLERLMSEIGNMRSKLRLMPDFQRREMAAKLAMKMAAMFADSDEEGFEDI